MPILELKKATTNTDGMLYSEGQGILTSTATGEMETYAFKQ